MIPSLPNLHNLCSLGDLPTLRTFIESTLPSLPPSSRTQYCLHTNPPCPQTPCALLPSTLLEVAAKSNQPALLAYILDELIPINQDSNTTIPWPCLRTAAITGSIPIGSILYNRDPSCFKTTEPAAPHGTKGGSSQIQIAMRHDQFAYVEYMLTHGADINAGLPEHSPVRAAVRAAIDEETSFRRIRYLVERGARVAGSGAIEAAVEEDRRDVVRYLISAGEADGYDVREAIGAAESC